MIEEVTSELLQVSLFFSLFLPRGRSSLALNSSSHFCACLRLPSRHPLGRSRGGYLASHSWRDEESKKGKEALWELTRLPLPLSLRFSFHFGSDWAAWKLYRELGWTAYKQVCDRELSFFLSSS